MSRYIVKRLFLIIFVAFIITIIMYTLYNIIPGSMEKQIQSLINPSLKGNAYVAAYNSIADRLGYDKPIIVRYFRWLGNVLTGDFGYTLTGQKIITHIGPYLKNTVRLNLVCMVFVFLITFPLGIITAVKKYSKFDNTVQVATSIGMSLPTFVIALTSIFFFCAVLKILPPSGVQSSSYLREQMTFFERFWDTARYMILPVFVMVITSLAGITRYVRGAMIDVLSQDFIRTARSKGLSEKVVIYTHAFRNASIPVVTILTGWFLGIFGGSTIIERIFAYEGMGLLLYNGLMTGPDYALVMAINLFYTVLGLFGNLLLDVIYTIVDPRVRLG